MIVPLTRPASEFQPNSISNFVPFSHWVFLVV